MIGCGFSVLENTTATKSIYIFKNCRTRTYILTLLSGNGSTPSAEGKRYIKVAAIQPKRRLAPVSRIPNVRRSKGPILERFCCRAITSIVSAGSVFLSTFLFRTSSLFLSRLVEPKIDSWSQQNLAQPYFFHLLCCQCVY